MEAWRREPRHRCDLSAACARVVQCASPHRSELSRGCVAFSHASSHCGHCGLRAQQHRAFLHRVLSVRSATCRGYGASCLFARTLLEHISRATRDFPLGTRRTRAWHDASHRPRGAQRTRRALALLRGACAACSEWAFLVFQVTICASVSIYTPRGHMVARWT